MVVPFPSAPGTVPPAVGLVAGGGTAGVNRAGRDLTECESARDRRRLVEGPAVTRLPVFGVAPAVRHVRRTDRAAVASSCGELPVRDPDVGGWRGYRSTCVVAGGAVAQLAIVVVTPAVDPPARGETAGEAGISRCRLPPRSASRRGPRRPASATSDLWWCRPRVGPRHWRPNSRPWRR